jgi:hypothetical protein
LAFVVVPELKVLFVELLGLADIFKAGLHDLFLDFLDVSFVEGVLFEGLSKELVLLSFLKLKFL